MINTEQQEVWKTYQKYPWIEVSNLGRVRTKDRCVSNGKNSKRLAKGHVLKQQKNNMGYMYVQFGLNGKNVHLLVHRLVAITFIPNPNGYLEVNHKDNDPTNNVASNLEWCTRQYNEDYKNNFGTSQAELFGLPVIAINLDNLKVLWFESRNEAARQLGIFRENIGKVLKGKRNKAGGCWFTYADENAVEKTRAKFGDDMANKVEKLLNEHRN